jgi:hypothetical protein
MLSCVVNYILQEINPLYLTRFRTYRIARPPNETKTLEGRGPQTDKHAAKSLYRSFSLVSDIWRCFLSV